MSIGPSGLLDVRCHPDRRPVITMSNCDRLRPFVADLRLIGQPRPDAFRGRTCAFGHTDALAGATVIAGGRSASPWLSSGLRAGQAGGAWRFRAWSDRAANAAWPDSRSPRAACLQGPFDRLADPTASAGDAATGFAAKSSSGVPRVRSGVASPVSLAKSARRGRRRSAQGGQVSDGRGERSGILPMIDAARRDRRTRSVGSRVRAADTSGLVRPI